MARPPRPPFAADDREVLERLAAALATYGRDWCDDPRRCEALLKDLLAAHSREIKLLVDAVEAGVVRELAGGQSPLPADARLRRCVRRLHDDMGLREDLACRAVGLWAIALGVADSFPVPAGNEPAAATEVRGDPAPPPSRGRGGRSAIAVGSLAVLGLVGTSLVVVGPRFMRPLERVDDAVVPGPRVDDDEAGPPPNVPAATPPVPSPAPPRPRLAVSGIRLRHRLLSAPTAHVREASLSPDGSTAAVEEPEYADASRQRMSGKARISLWDVDTGRKLRTLDGHDNAVSCLAFSPDGRLLASGGRLADKTIRLWDVDTAARRCTGPEEKWSPVHAVFLGTGPDVNILVVDAQAGLRRFGVAGCESTVVAVDGLAATPWCCDVSADGRRLVMGCQDGLRMMDLVSRRQLWHVPLGREEEGRFTAAATAVALSADGSEVLAAATERRFIPDESSRLDPTQAWETGRIRLGAFAAATGARLREFHGHDAPIGGVRFLEPASVISCDESGRVVVWDAATARPLLDQLVDEPPRHMVVSADERRLLLSGTETVTVWDLER